MVSIRQIMVLAMSVYSVSVSTIALYIFMENNNPHTVKGRFDSSVGTQPERQLWEGVLNSQKVEELQSNIRSERFSGKNICPDYPAGLKGKLTVDARFVLTEEEAESAAGEQVVEGCFKPPNCKSNQTVAIIIPYKNRQQHLITLLYHLHPILQRQSLRYCIFVPEQYDDGAFNKARVMNAGFLEILQRTTYGFDCLIFHDVDMLLEDDRNLYKCGEVPHHLSPAIDKFNYTVGYGTDFGGVGAVTVEQYKLVNGHSNRFYGWGGEDSDIETRFKLNKILSRRNNSTFGRYKMIPHQHSWNFSPKSGLGSFFNARDPRRSAVPIEYMKKTDSSGLSSIKYKVNGVKKRKLYTKITIDIRTFLINAAYSKICGYNSTVAVENPSITNERLDSMRATGITGFGVIAGDELPNYGCTFQHFPGKTVNMTLGFKEGGTYKVSYSDLNIAKTKCLKLSKYCSSILETSPGIYSLRSSGYMHELKLKYKVGRYPPIISTEKHTDISVYVKLCPKDIRFLQILDKPVVLSEKEARDKNIHHEVEFDMQMFQAEDFKLYYSYSIYSAHKAILEESEMIMNTSFGIYDSLSVTYSNSMLVFDTEVKTSYQKFLPSGYKSLEQVAENQGVVRLKTTPQKMPLLPGCYVCESAIKDHNGGVHMKWKWWFEIRGETQDLENRLLNEYLPHAPVGSTKFTENLRREFAKSLHLPGKIELSDDVLRLIARSQMKHF